MSTGNGRLDPTRAESNSSADIRDPGHSEMQALTNSAHQLIPWLETHIRFSEPKPPTVKTLTMKDVVDYFIENHPFDPALSHGALIRVKCPRGYIVFQVFLSAQDHILTDAAGSPHGRRLIANRMDADLKDRFQGMDLILFS